MNQSRIIVTGMWFASWMTRCAGNAASSRMAQVRIGASSRAASRIEFGGHRVDTGDGWIVNAKPTRAPMKYPTHTSTAATIVDARSVGILLIPLFSRLRPQAHDVGTPVARRSVHLQQAGRVSRLSEECPRALAAALALDQELAVCDLHRPLGIQEADGARRGRSIGAVARDRHLDIVIPIAGTRDLEKTDPLARDARKVGDRDRCGRRCRSAASAAGEPEPPPAAPPPAPAPAPAAPAPPPVVAPAPPPAPRPAPPKEYVANDNLKPVHFAFDKADIRPADAKILDASAKWLAANPNQILLIEGHCDERGTEAYNLALGDKRAKSAMNYLVAQGVQGDRITLVSFGEERPVCREQNEACWSKNRRDMFLVKEK